MIRNMWFDCYRSKESVYLRQENGSLQVLRSKNTPEFYSTGKTANQLPLESHLIHHKKIGEDLWNRAPHKVKNEENK